METKQRDDTIGPATLPMNSLTTLLCMLATVWSVSVGYAQTTLPQPSETSTGAETTTEADAVDALLRVLRDESQRNALIERLEAIEAPETDPASAQPSAPTPAPAFARRIADLTQTSVESAYDTVLGVWRDFAGIRTLVSGINEQRQARIAANAPSLLATMLSTLVLFWATTRLFARLAQAGERRTASVWGSFFTVVINAFADIIALALAYAAGYALAIGVFGQGDLTVEQTLFLNAFLVAGLARIAIRIFVLPDHPEQAVFNFSGDVQRAIYRRLMLLSGLLVYGITAAVPIANVWVSFLAGRSLRVTVVTLAAIIAIFSIRAISQRINAEQLEQQRLTNEAEKPDADAAVDKLAAAASEDTAQTTMTIWHRLWPWLGFLYVAFAYIIAITRPSLMADLVGLATVKTVIAGGLLALAFRFMRRASSAGAPVPKALQAALPELKMRLDGFVPLVLRLSSIALIVLALGFIVDAWHIFDFGGWISSPLGTDIIWRAASAVLIVAFIILVWASISSWIDNRLTLDLEGRNVSARSRTLLALFRNAATVALFVFGTMTALSQIGIDIAPLLAGAGVIGLAIGFGSQKLVQDIITGIFIQLDNAINEGDVVTVGGITGGVEKLTIRSVGLRDLHGTYHIVPFSSVDTVSNFMRKFAFHVAEIGVAYKESIPAVKDAMQEAFRRIKDTEHGKVIIGDLEMHGVTALADSSVNVRARIRTKPGQQWGVGREYTQIVKEVFDERGIEIPFPHRQMVYPAQPAKIETETT